MIYPLSGLLLGAIIGGFGARRRQGKALDLAQWAAVGAMIGGVLGLFALVLIERSYS
ncbi:hypothetical protein [Pelagovum sp. HNIBRBA483]|uniref:hypothetical protein n=1 Tax=Pelagovum sp. HNIBRBA483 TaxID=3233341 RepID=UPI0034A2159E